MAMPRLDNGLTQSTGQQNRYQQDLGELMYNPASFQRTPGYQFAFDQGQQAVARSGAARGQLGSGNVMTALTKYGQGQANQEYGNQFNRLSGLLGQQQQYDLGVENANTQRRSVNNQMMLGEGGLEQQKYGTDMGFASNMFGQMNQYNLGQQQNQRGQLSDLMSYDLGNRRLGVDENQNAALMLRSLVV